MNITDNFLVSVENIHLRHKITILNLQNTYKRLYKTLKPLQG